MNDLFYESSTIYQEKPREERKELYIQKMEIFGIQKIIMILLSYYMMASKYGLDW